MILARISVVAQGLLPKVCFGRSRVKSTHPHLGRSPSHHLTCTSINHGSRSLHKISSLKIRLSIQVNINPAVKDHQPHPALASQIIASELSKLITPFPPSSSHPQPQTSRPTSIPQTQKSFPQNLILQLINHTLLLAFFLFMHVSLATALYIPTTTISCLCSHNVNVMR